MTDASNKSSVTPLRKTQPCPECKRPSTREDYPFCSDRCRSADLSRWLKGSYAIPVAEDQSNAEEGDTRRPGDGDY